MKRVLSSDRRSNLRNLRRRLINSFIDLIILSKLRELNNMSGYDVISLVNREFHILVGSGSVYSVLYSLEREGLIKGTWIERRRIYKLTPEGKAASEATSHIYEKVEDFIIRPVA